MECSDLDFAVSLELRVRLLMFALFDIQFVSMVVDQTSFRLHLL